MFSRLFIPQIPAVRTSIRVQNFDKKIFEKKKNPKQIQGIPQDVYSNEDHCERLITFKRESFSIQTSAQS
jgi:hypothetical protein